MTQRLTVLIPCKNEQDSIVACLDSVRELADEILVADSGSTDATLELVHRRANCRVIEREFINSGDFKNWAIPQARHSWVFVLDADERVTPELAREIRHVLAGGPAFDGYWVGRVNHFMGHRLRHTSWSNDRVIRLFHRDRGRYGLHTDHAEVELPRDRVGELQNRLIHFTCWNYETYLPKMMRYTQQQADLWYAQGRRPSVWRMITTGPLRFLRSYVLDLGMLDGSAGFQVSVLTGFYSFLKQARLWQKWHGRKPAELEPLMLPGARCLPPAAIGDRSAVYARPSHQP
jgi:glycosyltransferase involved in cell wall biosynthesis